MMHTRVAAILAVGLLAAASPLAAQDESALMIFGLAGVQNSPAEYDAVRDVDYSAGYHVGGGVALRLYEHVAIRGDFVLASSDGTDTSGSFGEAGDISAIDEAVAFDRSYYGASLELSYPLAQGFTPYAFAGGGLVSLTRDAPSYAFDFTEAAALVGIGGLYGLGGSPVSVFVQGTGWLYQRQSVGGTQFDTVVSAGLAYTLPF